MAKKEIKGYIVLASNEYKISWLKSVTQDKAIEVLTRVGRKRSQIVNAWKQANGLTKRNYNK